MATERIGIIGGGVFGLAVANEFSQRYETVLFEAQDRLGNGTSSRNQARLQEGYLYAPDIATAVQCHEGAQRIRSRYPESLMPKEKSYYLFVNESRFKGPQFEDVCKKLGLPLEAVSLPTLDGKVYLDRIETAYLVDEYNLDSVELLNQLERDVNKKGGIVLKKSPVEGIDKTVSATFKVTTPRETVEVDAVINCAGPWVSQVARIRGYDLTVSLQKATFYVSYDSSFSESFTFVFDRKHGGTVIPNPSMGGVVLGHGEVNVEVSDPNDVTEISGGDVKTLTGLQKLTPLLKDVTLESLSPVTGVKVKLESNELRESSVIRHEPGFYSLVGGKLTASLYVAEQAREVIQKDL